MNPMFHALETPSVPQPTPQNSQNTGFLQIHVVSIQNHFPIRNATVRISPAKENTEVLEELKTNTSGQTPEIALPAPPESISLDASAAINERPYAEYDLRIEAPGFQPVDISGTEVISGSTAIQPVSMTPVEEETSAQEEIVIPDHTLYGVYPPKIAEPEIKPVAESGEIVLSRVVVPETIIVHDGVPSDRSAKNYYMPYRDYITFLI